MMDYKSIFEQISTPIFVLDQRGIFRAVNTAFEQYTGWGREQLLGQNCDAFLAAYAQKKFQETYLANTEQRHALVFKPNLKNEWQMVQDEHGYAVFTLLTHAIWASSAPEEEDANFTDPLPKHFFEKTFTGNQQAEVAVEDKPLADVEKERYPFSNQQLAEKLGYSSEEFKALGEDWMQSIIHPEDLERFKASREAILHNQETHIYDYEIRLRHRTGHYKWIYFTSIDLKHDEKSEPVHLITIARDVTKLKEAEVNATKFFAISEDLFVIADLEGYFIELNASWERVLGYDKEEMTSRPFTDFVHPDDVKNTLNQWAHLKKGISLSHLNNRFLHQDGSFRWFSWKAQPIVEKGIVYASARDITEKKQADEEMQKLNYKLIIRNRELMVQEKKLSLGNQKLLAQQLRLQQAIQELSDKKQLIEGIARALPAELNAYDAEQNKNLFSNHKLALILGYDAQRFAEMSDPVEQLIHPEDQASLAYAREQLKQGKEINSLKARLRHQEGYYKTMLITTVPLDKDNPNQFITINQDITELKKAEEALKQLNDRLIEQNKELARKEENLKRNNERLLLQRENIQHTLEKLLESQTLIEGIAKAIPAELNTFDLTNESVVFSNYKLADILGYPQQVLQSLEPEPLKALAHPDDLLLLAANKARLLQEEMNSTEIRAKHQDGHQKWVSVSHVLLRDESDVPRYIVTMAQDITERKRAEEELNSSNEKLIANQDILQRALTELSDRNFELDQLVYKISHDLRSPLSTILGLVNLIKLENEPNAVIEYVNHIENRVLKLDDFVKSMLNYAKANRTQIQLEAIDFHELVENCLADLEFLDSFKRIRTEINIAHRVTFRSDLLRLRIIFSNIISNAYKYLNPKSDHNYLKINIKVDKEMARIEFADNGIGIPREYLDKIFDMFFRATEKSDGSGLGMYIVKQTIDKLEGSIQVESRVGQGTTFFVQIPNLNSVKTNLL